jgi:hypothetical protein
LRCPYSAATWSSDAPTRVVKAETMVVRCSRSELLARIAAASESASSRSTGANAINRVRFKRYENLVVDGSHVYA